MAIYICATIFSVLFAFFASRKPVFQKQTIPSKYIISTEKNTKIGFYFLASLSFLPLFLVSAFRYNVGKDYAGTYRVGFEVIASGNDYKNFEIGFKLINKFVLLFTRDYAGLFIVTALLFCFFIYKAIYSQSINPAFSIFLLVTSGFYFYSMNAVRQCIAVAIFFYAVPYIENKKFIKYLFWILLASTIHLVALIFIPVYFIGNLKLSLLKTVIFLGISAAVLPLVQKFIYYIISFTKYSSYINSVYDTTERGYVMPLINFTIILFAYYYLHVREKDDGFDERKYRLLLNLQIVAAFLSLCLGVFPLASRLFLSFFYVQIFLVPLIVAQEKKRRVRVVIEFIILALYIVYFIYTVGAQNANSVLPYQTIFSK